MTENHLQNPFVIQCSKCDAILGDSFALLDFKHNFLILHTVSQNASKDVTKNVSKKSFDVDCTYTHIICKCKQNVGKYYYTVNKECNGFVDKFCLNRAFLKSYTLGNVQDKTMNLVDLCEEVEKLQRFCVYLHKKIDK
ncbi:hypothetical protein BDAP_000010 [Binucleata daphniae]